MSVSWVVRAKGSKTAVERALDAYATAEHLFGDVAISGFEASADRPSEWVLEAYFERRPGSSDTKRIASLFPSTESRLQVEQLADTDWVAASQVGMEPVEAGRFRIRTPDFAASDDPATRDFVIPAAQAFGTGHHETTSGCLMMLQHMRSQGVRLCNIADIGTGTGVLAFAARELWPRAFVLASDVDPLSVSALRDNAASNDISLGSGRGIILPVRAAGLEHPRILARAPFDAIIANILAGPLIHLAPQFAATVQPGGHVLLAGLLTEQEGRVRRAYRRAGFRLASRLARGDWSILWLRRRTW